MVKSPKFHIYSFNDKVLCWKPDDEDNDRAIEFETQQEAESFLKMVALYYPEIYEEIEGVVKNILYYDGGYIQGILALELMKKELREERGLNF